MLENVIGLEKNMKISYKLHEAASFEKKISNISG